MGHTAVNVYTNNVLELDLESHLWPTVLPCLRLCQVLKKKEKRKLSEKRRLNGKEESSTSIYKFMIVYPGPTKFHRMDQYGDDNWK